MLHVGALYTEVLSVIMCLLSFLGSVNSFGGPFQEVASRFSLYVLNVVLPEM